MEKLNQKLTFENQHSLHKIYLQTLNNADDRTPVHAALVEVKLITHQCNELENILTTIENADAKAHLEAMCTRSKDLLKILTKNSLYNIWITLSNLDLNSKNELFLKQMKCRKNDLLADIKEYYKMGKQMCSKYVKEFQKNKIHKISLTYKHSVSKFRMYAENMSATMEDLDERIAALMLLIDPNSRSKILRRMSTITQINMIVKRSQEIFDLFLSNLAGKSEHEEILRLNRRMIVVLQEAEFLKFSSDYEKKYEIIKRLVRFKVNHHNEQDEDPLIDVVLKINCFNEDTDKHCKAFMQKSMKRNRLFQHVVLTRDTTNYCTSQNKYMVKNFKNHFEEIAQKILVFNQTFEEIKQMIDETLKRKQQFYGNFSA